MQGILYVLVIGISLCFIFFAIRGKVNSAISNDSFPSSIEQQTIPKEVWEKYPELFEKQNQMMEEWKNNSKN